MMFRAELTRDHRWRIVLVDGRARQDICGAVDSSVAWQQCAILNRLRGYA